MKPIIYVTVISVLIPTVLTIYFYLRSQKFKELTTTIMTNTSVVEVTEPVPELKISYKGEEIEDLYVLTFQIKNTGTMDIPKEHFVSPLQVRTHAPILDAKIIDKDPKHLDIAINKKESDKITFTKSLFKTGESITVKLTLLSNPTIDFSLNRIRDLKRIVVTEAYRRVVPKLAVAITIIAVLIGAFSLYTTLRPRRNLLVTFTSITPLINIEKAREDLSIKYEGIDIKELFALKCVIMNTGNRPIRPTDYFEPLLFHTSGRILEVTPGESPKSVTEPWSLQVINPYTLEIGRPFINPGEAFTMTLLLSDSPDVAVVPTKIVGLKKVDTVFLK